MDERRIADYFVVAGLPDEPEPLDDNTLSEGGLLKASHGQAPITDISVIFPTLEETKPEDYEVITRTPSGLQADLNHGSLRTIECYLCIRRGRDKPPLVDIGVMYDGKEVLMEDAEVVDKSVGGNVANVNNSTSQTFITFRRGSSTMPCNALVVTDICVVIASKGESPPHAFCCINKNLNKGIVGSDVFLCYKKSMNRAKLLSYKPGVLSRYPHVDLPNFPFPTKVPLFCLPMGSTLELWPSEATRPKPVFSTFVLTVSDAKHKVYGSAVTFYEKFPKENLTDEQRELLEYESDSTDVLNVNKSICVLSHWPFSYDFQDWLMFLHDLVASGVPQAVPIERYIVQLMDEIPFPSPRNLLQLSKLVILTQPEDSPLPRSAAGFKQLLLNLGSENCLQVLLLALTEQKILIHSLRPDTLTAVAEAVSTFLFPFKWQCPYIPLCPLGLVEVLHAPLPFLIGVDSRFFDLYDPPSDVSCIDLDTNIITVAESHRHILNIKLLPKRAAKYLKATLDVLYHEFRSPLNVNNDPACQDLEMLFKKRKKEQYHELRIQEAFLKFMIMILRGYKSFLSPITKAPTVGTTDTDSLFQLNDFMKSRDKAHQKFFSLLIKTQMFIRFIEERSFVADGDQGLAFFDECTEKWTSEELGGHLIELDAAHKSDRTVCVLPPEQNGTDPYEYPQFFLNPTLMISKKRNHFSNLIQTVVPGSPMARRTKQEKKTAQKLAHEYVKSPEMWAKCLCGTCHTLYFMVLPSMLMLNKGKEKAILQQAYELLVGATKQRLACDEICYRLMMQLCGEHSRPLLAVKLLLLMKKYGIHPNALTYGLYNRCVLDAEWPAHSSSSQLLWKKLRNVVMGAAHFRWAARRHAARRLSASTEGGSSLLDPGDRTASRSSLDSHETIQANSFMDKLGRKVASIVRGSLNGLEHADKDATDAPAQDATSAEEPNEAEAGEAAAFVPDSPSEYRILSRSESGNDASLLDKLQSRKPCARTLQFSEEDCKEDGGKNSPGKMSPREVVTENDPLGAFEQPEAEAATARRPAKGPEPSAPTCPPALSDDPVLFKSSVQRSATFEGSAHAQSKIHRSETVPAATVASSLASLGSSLKMGFGPSSYTSKKSNELIQGGLSSIKSAATSMAKKLDEIKEAISTSANSTPVKSATAAVGGGGGTGDSHDASLSTADAEATETVEGGGDRRRRVSAEVGSHRGSYANLKDAEEPLPDCLFPLPSEEKPESEVDVTLTSCSECHNCQCILYDEDIMANWAADDSNLNTICTSCGRPTVPLLSVTVTGGTVTPRDTFSVPYLNPLVLRKELENIMTQEGDLSLAESNFIDEHPIIYWNLIWTFERINVQTHLPNLYMKNGGEEDVSETKRKENDAENGSSEGLNLKPVEEGTDPLTLELAALERLAAKVNVRCLWDDPKLHSGVPPMYVIWQKLHETSQSISPERKTATKAFMQQIIYNIRGNNLIEPLKTLGSEREKDCRNKLTTSNSVYRDILFLACKAIGRSMIEINNFDREYTAAYTRVTERQGRMYRAQDKPISLNSLYCRQYFRPLTLP
ncbi:unnamed protein product [Brassicogethes aeneus]|uniref:C-myc promoter-binding protein n=1 Tax=Brassicogethes aeneus TaxID=1431903 RepID=A0A9P0AZ63_BRAAE|nr:unnamed protein product [Brassicogethes aeneus]